MEIRVEAGGEVRLLRVKRGENLMEALLRHGVTLPHPCRGKGKCGKCRVGISDWGGEVGPDVTQKKESDRLACMTEIKGPVSVHLGSKGGFGKLVISPTDRQVKKTDASPSHVRQVVKADAFLGHDRQVVKADASPSHDRQVVKADASPAHVRQAKVKAISPPFHRTCAHIPEGDNSGESGTSPWARLVGGFSGKDRKALEWGMETALPFLEGILPEAGGPVTLTRAGKRFFALEAGDTVRNRLGAAIVISDGLLLAALVRLEDGRVLETSSTDMTCGPGGKALISAMNAQVDVLCGKSGKNAAEISDAVIAGDCLVLYSLTKLIMKKADLAAWAGNQPLPVITSRQMVRAEKLGLGLSRHAGVWLPPAGSAEHGPDWVLSRLAFVGKDAFPDSPEGEKDTMARRALKGAISCLLDSRGRREAVRLADGQAGAGKPKEGKPKEGKSKEGKPKEGKPQA
jgi:ferredoxin